MFRGGVRATLSRMERDIYEIRMAHPAKNALDDDLIAWLETELERAGEAPILLTGSDGAFSAGLNLKRVAEMDAAAMRGFLERLDAMLRRLFLHPAPTVAAVNGHAIAGGCVLMLACDVALVEADPRLRIGLNEVALGACFPPAVLRLVRHRLAPQWHERVLLGAGLFGAGEALTLGLATQVVEGVEPAAREQLAALAAHPARTYALTKKVLRGSVLDTSDEDRRRFLEEEVPLWTSDEVRARIAAVLAR